MMLSLEHLQRYAIFRNGGLSLSNYGRSSTHVTETPVISSSVGKVLLMSSFNVSGLLMATFNDLDITINAQCYCGALPDFLHQENAAGHSHLLHDNGLPRVCPVMSGTRSPTCIAHAHLTCQRVNSMCSAP
jgi:hypothetical protein